MKHPSNDFLQEYLLPLPSQRGCALLGKTEFDKLGTVRCFLTEQEFNEWDGKSDMERHFIVHDCQHKAQRETIVKIVKKYKDASYVIFTNCEQILKDKDIICMFVHLIDQDEYSGKYCLVNSQDGNEEFSTSSFYVFVGNENLIPRITDSPIDEKDQINSFCSLVHCYDFNLERRYFGW